LIWQLNRRHDMVDFCYVLFSSLKSNPLGGLLTCFTQPSENVQKRQEAAQPFNNDYNGSHFTSPPSYPSPWGSGAGDWAAAYEKARAFVSQLTLLEKVNLTTGVG